MKTLAAFVVLGTVLLLACGGVSRGGSEGGSNAGASSGAASPTGGAGTVGGSSGSASPSGGAGVTSSANCGDAPLSPPCERDCGADPNDALSLECVAGSWQCPPGSVPEWSCPLGTCARRHEQACCEDPTGHGTAPECGSDGMIHCPPDSRVIEHGGLCLPDAVQTTSCGLLQGMPCSNTNYECHQGPACGATNCTCAADGAGLLAWHCDTNPC